MNLPGTTSSLRRGTPRAAPAHAGQADAHSDVSRLFDASAALYDRLNRVMSLGMGERYRGEVLARAGLAPGMTVLDVGSGTGVISAHAQRMVGPAGRVIALDPSHGMLEIAHRERGLETLQATAEHIPLPDHSVDFLVMGYALRHLAQYGPAFAEFARVLRPGGRLLMLELVPPPGRFTRWAFNQYLRGIIPWLTTLGRRERATARRLMDYTWVTIVRAAPPPQTLEALREAGFTDTAFRAFGQVLGEYMARRP